MGRLSRHFMDGGLDHLVSRDGARERNRLSALLAHGACMKLALGLCFFIGAVVYLLVMTNLTKGEMAVIYVSLFGSALLSLSGLARSGFTAIERMEFILYANAPARTLSIGLLFIAVWFSLPLILAAVAIALEGALWLGILAWIGLRFISFHGIRLNRKTFVYLALESWPLALFGFFTALYLNLDVVMIQALMGGVEAVAPYTFASMLMEGLSMLIGSYFLALYPVLSRQYAHDLPAFHRLFSRSVIVALLCSLPISALLAFWPGEWLSLLRDTGPETTEVLRTLALTLNLSMLNTLLAMAFMASGKQVWLALLTPLAVGASFGANWLWIPIYQQPGAAYASLAAQAFLLAVMGAAGIWKLALDIPWRRIACLVGATLAAALICKTLPLPVLAIPFAYGAVWLIMIWAMGTVNFTDLRRVIEATRQSESHG